MAWAVRLRELSQRYGKVALGVHFSVSAMSTATLYVAIKNNVDVVSTLQSLGLFPSKDEHNKQKQRSPNEQVETVWSEETWSDTSVDIAKSISDGDAPSKSTASSTSRSMGALGLALLCNKALFPVRVPITVALTPPVSKLLARLKRARNY